MATVKQSLQMIHYLRNEHRQHLHWALGMKSHGSTHSTPSSFSSLPCIPFQSSSHSDKHAISLRWLPYVAENWTRQTAQSSVRQFVTRLHAQKMWTGGMCCLCSVMARHTQTFSSAWLGSIDIMRVSVMMVFGTGSETFFPGSKISDHTRLITKVAQNTFYMHT
jgi:hypothetical protein